MADTRALLIGLTEYRDSQRRHLVQARTDFEALERRWYSFSAVYDGDGADQFRAHWGRTVAQFQEYVERTEKILLVLDERIEHLREVNKTESGLG